MLASFTARDKIELDQLARMTVNNGLRHGFAHRDHRNCRCCELLAQRIRQCPFPVYDGSSLPWCMIDPHVRQATINHGQTLERLAQRGGLSCFEAVCVLQDWNPRDHRSADWHADLETLIQADQTARIEYVTGEIRRRTEVFNDAICWLKTYQPVGGRYTAKELKDFDTRLDALKTRWNATDD